PCESRLPRGTIELPRAAHPDQRPREVRATTGAKRRGIVLESASEFKYNRWHSKRATFPLVAATRLYQRGQNGGGIESPIAQGGGDEASHHQGRREPVPQTRRRRHEPR